MTYYYSHTYDIRYISPRYIINFLTGSGEIVCCDGDWFYLFPSDDSGLIVDVIVPLLVSLVDFLYNIGKDVVVH